MSSFDLYIISWEYFNARWVVFNNGMIMVKVSRGIVNGLEGMFAEYAFSQGITTINKSYVQTVVGEKEIVLFHYLV